MFYAIPFIIFFSSFSVAYAPNVTPEELLVRGDREKQNGALCKATINYMQAGKEFKKSQKTEESQQAFTKAAQTLMESATIYLQSIYLQSITFNTTIIMPADHHLNGTMIKIARIYELAAEAFVLAKDVTQAIESFIMAADFYEAVSHHREAARLYMKSADLASCELVTDELVTENNHLDHSFLINFAIEAYTQASKCLRL